MQQATAHSISALSKQLLIASRQGNDSVVQNLLAEGATFTSDWLGTSALHLACMNGHVSTVQLLTRAGISWDGRTKADKTPLHYAAQHGHSDVVTILLNLGANINATDMLQMTPLHWAVIEGHFLVVKLLIENNADLEIQNKFDKTPLQSAQDECKYHIVEYIKSSMNHLNYEEEPSLATSPASGSASSVLASLAALSGSSAISDNFPWIHQESVASGAPVLLEGANMVTLTEAGKLALQAWSNLYDDEPSKENKISNLANASSPESEQKAYSISLANPMLSSSSSSFGSGTQPITFVVSPQKTKNKLNDGKFLSPKRKRKLSDRDTCKSRDVTLGDSAIEQKEDLERKLAMACSEIALYREKLQMKEEEAQLCKKKLEVFKQGRR
ncbi:uncharacterized protein LOC143464605 isoform X2 [Clavelina lepadiformis]|uniref:uncharacterized protein LOC143464605 isoform X2 n=1 Tax=Clavelina lepadiformis TaxID=159417 RepID=UPI0040416049